MKKYRNRNVNILMLQIWVCIIAGLILSKNAYSDDTIYKQLSNVSSGGEANDIISDGMNDVSLPDLYTGAMSYSVPIEVPAGKHGLTPK